MGGGGGVVQGGGSGRGLLSQGEGEGEGRRRMEDGDWKVLAYCLSSGWIVLCCVLSRPRPACIGVNSNRSQWSGTAETGGNDVATHQAKQTTTSDE